MLNTYHGKLFNQAEINALEEYWGFNFWKVEYPTRNGMLYTYYACHTTWRPEQRISTNSFSDLFRFLEYPDESGIVHYRPDRITRRRD